MAKNSITFIAGPPKSYKSFVTITMLCELACGAPLFGVCKKTKHGAKSFVFPVSSPQRVLYIEQEIGEPDLQQRMALILPSFTEDQQKLILENFYSVSCDHNLSLDREPGVKKIEEAIIATRPDIVVFDPLREFHTLDENSSQDMTMILRYLDWLRERHAFASVIIHHEGKPNEARNGPDRLRGSSVMYGKGDSFIMVKRRKGDAPDNDEDADEAAATLDDLYIETTLRRGKPIKPYFLGLDLVTVRARFLGWRIGRRKKT